MRETAFLSRERELEYPRLEICEVYFFLDFTKRIAAVFLV